MKYSVVIPAYNCEKTIEMCVNSIIEQYNPELIDEIIIVNDGSTDQSDAVIRLLRKKCNKIIVIDQNNRGASRARNVGINAAKNDWIALMDSDDKWEKNKMVIQNDILIRHPEIKALGSNRKGEIIHLGKKIDDLVYKISPFQYCMKNWPCTPSLVFNKTVFDSKSFFPENMTHAEEGLFFLYLSKKVGLYYCENSLVVCGDGKMRFGEKGLSANLLKMHEGIITMLNNACALKYINIFEKEFLLFYEAIKYVRRILIVKKNRLSKNET